MTWHTYIRCLDLNIHWDQLLSYVVVAAIFGGLMFALVVKMVL